VSGACARGGQVTKSATALSVTTPQTLSGRFYLGRVPNNWVPVRKPHVAAGLSYRGCHARTRKSHLNWAWVVWRLRNFCAIKIPLSRVNIVWQHCEPAGCCQLVCLDA